LNEEKGGKLKDIRETASDAVEILRELGTPGVQESLDKAREIAIIAKEIMETLKTPEWQQNLENIRLLSQNMNSASTQLGDTMKEFKETGIIEDTQQLIRTAKAKMDSFGREDGVSSKDLKELSVSFNEMVQSIKGLIDELRLTVAEAKKSQTLGNIQETVKEVSDAYRRVAKSSSKVEP
jgi:methyl-accepting chemotaxis protein